MVRRFVSAALAASLLAGGSLVSVAALAQDADNKQAEQDKGGEPQVVAVVDGDEIYLSDLEDAKGLLPPQFQQLPLQNVYGILLNSLIDRKLAADAAREKGMHEDDEFKRQMSRIEDQVLQRAFVSDYLRDAVTDEMLQERYEEFKADFEGKEEVHARHILVETEDQAKDVIAELDKGADFAELAKERSTGPSGPNGGDLGFFGKDEMVPAFAEAAFALDAGAVTEAPVETRFGWHVIKVEERRAAEAPSFEEAKEQLRSQVAQEVASDLIARLRREAEVTAYDLEGNKLEPNPAAKGE